MFRHSTLKTAIVIASVLVLAACSEEKPADPRTQAPLVRTVTITTPKVESRAFTGVIAARVESALGFQVSGKVLKRLVNTGQQVKKGQVLMQLDPIDLQLTARTQAEAVIAAKARAKQATDNQARFIELHKTGAISASSYDQAKSAADSAVAQLHAVQAQAEIARNAIRYTNLVADADGTVITTLAEPGQVVNAGQIVIRMAHAGVREAVIQLPETVRPALGSRGQAQLFGKRHTPSVATLRQLSDAADPASRTFEARYVLSEALQHAPLGATITVTISGKQPPADGLRVPIGALFDAGNGTGVWRVTGEPSKVSWRPVTVLSLRDDAALISGQIQQGEQVISFGAHLLHDGEQVRVADWSSTAVTEEVRP